MWRQIRIGMTADQAQRFLGAPIATESTNTLDVWYYQDAPSGGERPSAGRLVFRKSVQGTQLEQFNQPDWSRVPDWQQLNQDYQKQLAEQRLQTRPQPRQVASPQPSSRSYPIRRPNESQTQARPIAQSQPAPAKPDSSKLTSRYFIGCGIAFGVIALIIAICQGSKIFPKG
ncbi:MAG: outer membrane protein assembly factor BamE [Planctomycetaceae bacterium]|nr:outer membrane protein assembly factor BamE [Planctomycetaceae bacterium]